jgi:hypothetical protein
MDAIEINEVVKLRVRGKLKHSKTHATPSLLSAYSPDHFYSGECARASLTNLTFAVKAMERICNGS